MVRARPQLALPATASSTWCCATGDVLVACEVKTRAVHGVRARRSRRSPRPRLARLHRLAARWVRGARRAGPTGPRRPGRPCSARGAAPRSRPRRGGWADAVRHHPHRRARPARSATSSTSRPTSRRAWSPRRWSAGPTPSLNEARDRCRIGDPQQPASTGRPPGGSRSCSRRPTCPSAAPTSTWPSPSRVLGATGRGARRRRCADAAC